MTPPYLFLLCDKGVVSGFGEQSGTNLLDCDPCKLSANMQSRACHDSWGLCVNWLRVAVLVLVQDLALITRYSRNTTEPIHVKTPYPTPFNDYCSDRVR